VLSDVQAAALQAEGRTVSWLAQRTPAGPQALGWLAFGDEPKPTARAAIEELHRLGIHTTMISGDNAGAAAYVARQLGLEDYEANVLPRDKAKRVEALERKLAANDDDARDWSNVVGISADNEFTRQVLAEIEEKLLAIVKPAPAAAKPE